MAQYRVLQDIEAEDKLLGPLSLRQFIYAIIALLSGYLAYVLFLANPFLALLPLPIFAFFGLLASPFFGGQQSSEVYLLAIIRFFIKPRKRVWDQAGLKQLVTITAPKKDERQLTKNHTQEEVQSRLGALANTLDSRGWVIKNVQENLSAQTPQFASLVYGQQQSQTSDRLVDPSSFAQTVPDDPIADAADMFDTTNSKVAQNFTQMIQVSESARREQIVQQMQNPKQDNNNSQDWFVGKSPTSTTATKQAIPTTTSADEQALLESIHKKTDLEHKAKSHLKTVKPLSEQKAKSKSATHSKTEQIKSTNNDAAKKEPNPINASLSTRNDLTVDTIAREAERGTTTKSLEDDGEVVVSLH